VPACVYAGRVDADAAVFPLGSSFVSLVPVYDKYFGPFDPAVGRAHVCSFGFEPNPRHKPILDAISERYTALGWRTHIQIVGVLDRDDVLHFDHTGGEAFDGQHQNWGGHFLAAPSANSEIVKVIDFPKWFRYHILERQYDTSLARPTPPTIVMKVRHEGEREREVQSSVHLAPPSCQLTLLPLLWSGLVRPSVRLSVCLSATRSTSRVWTSR
jgi:hypothetical protein